MVNIGERLIDAVVVLLCPAIGFCTVQSANDHIVCTTSDLANPMGLGGVRRIGNYYYYYYYYGITYYYYYDY